MRVPRLDAPRLLLVGVLLIAAGVVLQLGVYQWDWFGDEWYGVLGDGFDVRFYVFTVLSQVLGPLGVAFVAGAFVLAALTPRERPDTSDIA